MEWGFGSPDLLGGTIPPSGTVFDKGFGAPDITTTADSKDTGFGSPFYVLDPSQILILSFLGQFGDEGGELVPVVTDWPITGPYRFRLLDAEGTPYPTDDFCYSGIPDAGTNCFVRVDGPGIIRFVLPSAPPGVYTLRVEYGPGFGTQVDKAEALVVVTRNRARDVYQMRKRLPELYKTGPALAQSERLLP